MDISIIGSPNQINSSITEIHHDTRATDMTQRFKSINSSPTAPSLITSP